jgi:hypothetical protein
MKAPRRRRFFWQRVFEDRPVHPVLRILRWPLLIVVIYFIVASFAFVGALAWEAWFGTLK